MPTDSTSILFVGGDSMARSLQFTFCTPPPAKVPRSRWSIPHRHLAVALPIAATMTIRL